MSPFEQSMMGGILGGIIMNLFITEGCRIEEEPTGVAVPLPFRCQISFRRVRGITSLQFHSCPFFSSSFGCIIIVTHSVRESLLTHNSTEHTTTYTHTHTHTHTHTNTCVNDEKSGMVVGSGAIWLAEYF